MTMKRSEIAERQRLALDYFDKAHIILTEEEKARNRAELGLLAEDDLTVDEALAGEAVKPKKTGKPGGGKIVFRSPFRTK